MRKEILFILLSFGTLNLHAQTKKDQAFPQFKLDNTELRSIHSQSTGRDYLLYVGYPDSYFKHPEKKYPIVYTTDGYWNFNLTFTIGPGLWNHKQVPEYIVVGIGYAGENINVGKERMYELSPNNQDYGWTSWCDGKNCKMGGSRLFLDAIKKEIIPYVETNLRVDTSFRVLLGKSMGGLFSLYTMYEEPGLFNGIIAISPVVDWNHCWLFQRENELRFKVTDSNSRGIFSLHTRLYMAVGGAEDHQFIGSIKAMNEIILDAEYKDFDYEFKVIEGEDHESVSPESFNRGIRFVFNKKNKI